jgi:hypothetical protein
MILLQVLTHDRNWWLVRNVSGHQGYVPKTFLQTLAGAPVDTLIFPETVESYNPPASYPSQPTVHFAPTAQYQYQQQSNGYVDTSIPTYAAPQNTVPVENAYSAPQTFAAPLLSTPPKAPAPVEIIAVS